MKYEINSGGLKHADIMTMLIDLKEAGYLHEKKLVTDWLTEWTLKGFVTLKNSKGEYAVIWSEGAGGV